MERDEAEETEDGDKDKELQKERTLMFHEERKREGKETKVPILLTPDLLLNGSLGCRWVGLWRA